MTTLKVTRRSDQGGTKATKAIDGSPVSSVDLRPGDSIEIVRSHELRIDGDTSWVKYGVRTFISPDETAQEAHTRALRFLAGNIEVAVTETVNHVQRMSESA